MLQRIISAITMALFFSLLVSCSIKESRFDCIEPIRVSVKVDDPFSYDVTGFDRSILTKADASSSVSRIVLAVFNQTGDLVKQFTQAKGVGNDTFGNFEFTLEPGSYCVVAVGHRVSGPDLPASHAVSIMSSDSAIMPDNSVCDTFSGLEEIEILPGEDVELSMALSRIVSKFSLHISDRIPSDAVSLDIVFNTDNEFNPDPVTFNPSNGNAIASKRVISFDLTSYRGREDMSFENYLFLSSSEESIKLTAYVSKSDGEIIASHDLVVPFKRNRCTIATGRFFDASVSFGLEFNNVWDNSLEVEF